MRSSYCGLNYGTVISKTSVRGVLVYKFGKGYSCQWFAVIFLIENRCQKNQFWQVRPHPIAGIGIGQEFCNRCISSHYHAANIIVIADDAAGTKKFPISGMNKSILFCSI